MKRRKFLQGLLAVTSAAAIPSSALVSEGRCIPPANALGGTSPAALQRCAFFDYDDNLVMEGKFEASPTVIIPVQRRRFAGAEPEPVTFSTWNDAVFERVGNPRARPIRYEQVSGPRMPRRGYVI